MYLEKSSFSRLCVGSLLIFIGCNEHNNAKNDKQNIYEPFSVKTGLNDIGIKIKVTASLESIGFFICFFF